MSKPQGEQVPQPAGPSGRKPRAVVPDQVDQVVDFWVREDPTTDVTLKSLGARLRRVGNHIERGLRTEFASHGVEIWEMDVLLALRRSPGHGLGAGELMRLSQVTSGAITNRVARLEAKGWVRRDVDTTDRRQVAVTLTSDGVRRTDDLLAIKTSAEQRFFAGSDRAVLERMTDDLRTLLVLIEGSTPSVDGGPEDT